VQQRRIPFHRKPWRYDNVWLDLLTYDLAIIPWDLRRLGMNHPPIEQILSKSANRLTQLMSAGLPVIASPVPAYLPIVMQGVNGFIAHTQTDWESCFELLRDPGKRERIGQAARGSVLHRYSAQAQADALSQMFGELLDANNEG
jgi:hypothetical protein